MGMLSMLFGKTELTDRTENRPQPTVPQQLFVDNSEPETKEEKCKTPLDEFMDKDYSLLGYRDGYNYHGSEILEQRKMTIKAEYRLTLDKMICGLDAKVHDLQSAVESVKDASQSLAKRMEIKLAAYIADQQWLIQEKINSAIDEGLVMKHVHIYKDNFLKGMADYYMEKELALSTGLFDSK